MGKTVSLVLGSGGARGFAHVGAIQELVARGYEIKAVSGSSMGAAVGGIYAAGSLNDFAEWATNLNRSDTFRLMDFTFSSQGFIKGTKILSVLREIVGEKKVEDFDIDYTAVATDLNTHEEVWLQSGELFDVIRASSAIPTLVTPAKIGDRILVDGGVLNPLPVEPVLTTKSDLLVVVNINGWKKEEKPNHEQKIEKEDKKGSEEYKQGVIGNVKSWLNMGNNRDSKKREDTLGYLGLLSKSFDLMQDKLCERSIELYKPDIIINISREAGTTFELHKANDLMVHGQEVAAATIDEFEGLTLKD